MEELERKIQRILFPTIELRYDDYCKQRGLDPDDKKAWQKWVNRKCDVLALWSHIWYDGDIFVTSDKDFHKKTVKLRLIELGAARARAIDEEKKKRGKRIVCLHSAMRAFFR